MRSGFVGTVGPAVARIPAIERALADGDSVILDAPWGWIAARPRASERLSVARSPTGLTLAVLGSLVDASASPPRQITARDLLPHLATDEPGAALQAAGFEGGYQLLVVDERRRTVHLINDHLASRAVYHTTRGSSLCFGRSEAEVTRLCDLPPRLCWDGAAGFLVTGYPLGALTLTEGVERLRPARYLTAQADGSVRESHWWDLTFDDPSPRRLGEAVDELHGLARVSLEAALAGGEPVALALTGGYDSRLLLGLLREAGRLPETAFTWFHRPDVAGSDPEVARELARRTGVAHRALSYAPESFAVHLDDWLRTSALGSDNLGHFCAGERFLADHGLSPRPVLLGDHVLGLGGEFATDDDAIASVLRTPWPTLSPALRAMLTPEGYARVRASVADQVATIAGATDARRPKDLHHYLYFHVGVFGWLLAPGYYKEPVLEARRPLASRALLAAAARWPAALRHDKRVVVALLRERFQDLHAVPIAERSALVDWLDAVRHVPSVANSLGDMLDEASREGISLATELRQDVVTDRFAAVRRARASGERGRARALAVRVRRALGQLPLVARPLGRVERLLRRTVSRDTGPDDDVRNLFRVGLLAAYERQLTRGAPSLPQATDETDGSG